MSCVQKIVKRNYQQILLNNKDAPPNIFFPKKKAELIQ